MDVVQREDDRSPPPLKKRRVLTPDERRAMEERLAKARKAKQDKAAARDSALVQSILNEEASSSSAVQDHASMALDPGHIVVVDGDGNSRQFKDSQPTVSPPPVVNREKSVFIPDTPHLPLAAPSNPAPYSRLPATQTVSSNMHPSYRSYMVDPLEHARKKPGFWPNHNQLAGETRSHLDRTSHALNASYHTDSQLVENHPSTLGSIGSTLGNTLKFSIPLMAAIFVAYQIWVLVSDSSSSSSDADTNHETPIVEIKKDKGISVGIPDVKQTEGRWKSVVSRPEQRAPIFLNPDAKIVKEDLNIVNNDGF